MSRAVMQQALEALMLMRDKYEEYACPGYACPACDHADAAITTLRKALAEPEQEPFILQTDALAMRRPELRESRQVLLTAGTAIYTAPTPRKPLSDEEIKAALVSTDPETKRLPPGFRDFARAIERAHGIAGEGAA